MRKKIIAGNWKMNKTPSETVSFINELKDKVLGVEGDVVVCPTFVCLKDAVAAAKGTNIKVGAQNIHWADNGAFTGEISGEMLKEIGVDYVIIGHSERRQYFAETDETVNNRLKAALKYELKPIVCVGETLEQREAGTTNTVLETQTVGALKDIPADAVSKMVIAYEPVWAIGTGKTASSTDANDACKFIRSVVEKLYNKEVAENIRIQYGGSVKPANANELFTTTDIDGGLVGGASLKIDDFTAIVKY
ncbi:MAG: triose-phosphate isomerase [Clostridia bacterium]|nr:triose-phosphate isomerase [Clostridia bacterium]